MNAVVLIHANPGFHEKAKALLKNLTVKDAKVWEVCHVFGRFDGVIFCEVPNLSTLNVLGEALRKDGVTGTFYSFDVPNAQQTFLTGISSANIASGTGTYTRGFI